MAMREGKIAMPENTAASTSRLDAIGTRYTAHVAAHEWRWVIIVGCSLVLLMFVPLIWVALRGTPGWQFMGTLHNYLDGATYLAKMRIGEDGGWAVQFLHTPEVHDGAFIMLLYPLLGNLAHTSGLPLLVVFHAGRVIASLIMYAALYHLAATIWMNVTTRRIFFTIAAVGAGFGWALIPVLGGIEVPDLFIPEAFPLVSTFVNVHFPLTIGALALLVSILILAFRPAVKHDPAIDSMWWAASALSFALALLYPQSLVPIGGALALVVLLDTIERRQVSLRSVVWLLAVALPALPVAVYYLMIVRANDVFAQWNAQNLTLAPPIWSWIIGLGFPLLLGIPALFRAIRRMEPDGDRFMLFWLIAIFVAMYLPTNVQRRFSVGIMLPIAYFATRALRDVWLPLIPRRVQRLLVSGVVLIAMSPLFLLFIPALPAMVGNPDAPGALFLDSDYAEVYRWIDTRTDENDVVLASPDGSIWLPGWAGARVVYGHAYETIGAAEKEALVRGWYAETDPTACSGLIEQFNIRYILFGPEEAALGQSVCFEGLRELTHIGDVTIYVP